MYIFSSCGSGDLVYNLQARTFWDIRLESFRPSAYQKVDASAMQGLSLIFDLIHGRKNNPQKKVPGYTVHGIWHESQSLC